MAKIIVVLMVFVVAGHGAATFLSASPKEIEAVDLFGSNRVTIEAIRTNHGELLDGCLEQYVKEEKNLFFNCSQQFSKEVKSEFGFVFVDLSVITYVNLHNIPGKKYFATIDVVEPEDEARRLNFLPRPHQLYPDPGMLVSEWDRYMEVGTDLLIKSEISGTDALCPAFHCIFGHDHPKLQAYAEIFRLGASKFKKQLIEILYNDARDQFRANAAFLLAYSEDGKELVEILRSRIKDSSFEVRNNVMRVFSEIARKHPGLNLPFEELVEALDFPETTDRNKASAAIYFSLIPSDSLFIERKRHLIKNALPFLLEILKLEQPNNHDFAYLILQKISGLDFGDRDIQSWELWARS